MSRTQTLVLALVAMLSSVSAFAWPNQTTTIYGGRAGGYDTAYCPSGARVTQCSFNPNTCDNTSQGYDYCSADSRNNRPCNFTGVCEYAAPAQPDYQYISGGRANGYDTAYCPSGYVIQSCSFDSGSCDGTSQGSNFCSADSRNHRPCSFTGVCVRNW
jgi:hypothetical protein